MRRFLIYITAVAASLLALSSCSDEEPAVLSPAIYPGEVKLIFPADVEMLIYTDAQTGTQVLPLVKGETVQLGYSVGPENVTYTDVKWSSSNEVVATVDANGLLTAKSGGDTGFSIIQLTPDVVYSGSGISGSIRAVVVDELLPASSLEIYAEADEVYVGESVRLSFSLLPIDATYRTVKWSSSDETIATVDKDGLVTGVENPSNHATVTISATTLDGTKIVASKEIVVNKIIQPIDVDINQAYSAEQGYLCAIADKKLVLSYTTTPEDCTKSLIEWTSSDENIATVKGGVVSFNDKGVFGKVTISARCPETNNSSAITLSLEAGLLRELFLDEQNYGWYNAKQSGNGTASSHVWSTGKVTVTTYKQNATNQRGDFRCWNPKTWLHAGNYPILAIRMDDLKDMGGVTKRNITLDASGVCDGVNYSGGLDGNNNKWLHDYKCSDGSHVFIYDLATQKWATGGVLPTTSVAEFTTLQFKYADISPLSNQVTYNVYWVQTFKTVEDVKNYLNAENLTYEIIK